MYKFYLALFLGLIAPLSWASEFMAGYQQGAQTGNSSAEQAENIVRHFNPETVPGYTRNPAQAKHYGGTEQSSTDIASHGAAAASTSESGQAIHQSFDKRPLYRVDTNSPGIQRSNLISNRASNIARGISDAYVDCKNTRECKTVYTEQSCQESAGIGEVSCTQDLLLYATPQQPKHQTIALEVDSHLSLYSFTATGEISLSTGEVFARSNPTVRAKINQRLNDTSCKQNLKISYELMRHPQIPYLPEVTLTTQPICENNFRLGFHLKYAGGPKKYMGVIILLKIESSSPHIEERWSDSCQSLEQRTSRGLCTKIETVCSQPNQTRIINDVPVHRPCWQQRTRYRCGNNASTDTCSALRQQGCEQLGSRCAEMSGSQCVRYEQNFRCPKEQCSNNNNIVCNDRTFCLDGKCTEAKPSPADPKETAESLSYLSGVADASKQFDKNSRFIFKGQRLTCRRDIVNFRNCCQDKGWGVDLRIATCSDEEKKLGHSKEKKLTLEVGEYCAKKFMGTCIERRKSYCSFPSKIARIIQEQGRIRQLGIPLGDPEHTPCDGVSAEQLQQINFQKIDFTDFYEDLKKYMKFPNEDDINRRLQETIQGQERRGTER